MNIIVWILFGALVGWIASLIMSTSHEQGLLKDIVIGICGALLGGFIAKLFGLGTASGFDGMSWLLAVTGAVIITAILKATGDHA